VGRGGADHAGDSEFLSRYASSTPEFQGNRGMIERVCEVCREPIRDEDQWFRVREEYVHLSCSEKYLNLVSHRRQRAKTAPPKPDTGGKRSANNLDSSA